MLYAITDSILLPSEKLFSAVEETLSAGCRWVQYRDKSQDEKKRFYESTRLLEICTRYDASLIINDDPALAKKIGAQGVHLGQGDGDVQEARKLLGTHAIVGVTCHNSLELAEKAIEDGASYIAFGRFFSSNTKPDAHAADLSLLQQARKQFPSTTIVAIGGITPENAKSVLTAGADTLAVCHALFASDEIRRKTELFLNLDLQQ